MTTEEFYRKHCLIKDSNGNLIQPEFRDIDKALFDAWDETQKTGGSVIYNKRRFNHDAYIHSLTTSARLLNEGKSICLITQKVDSYLADLKRLFGIDAIATPNTIKGKIQTGSYHLKLQDDTEQI